MKVFIAGATGALGRRLVPLLVAEGHDVTGMTRTPEKRGFSATSALARSWPTRSTRRPWPAPWPLASRR